MKPDPFNLRRFITAQEPVIKDALDELRAGQKASHWMWFVFPQIQGLGSSMASVTPCRPGRRRGPTTNIPCSESA
jgi:uncharacterized protein (DUF1810 family)